jgi:hypothetical protein
MKNNDEYIDYCISKGLNNIYRFKIDDMEEDDEKIYIHWGKGEPGRDKVEYWDGKTWRKFDEK